MTTVTKRSQYTLQDELRLKLQRHVQTTESSYYKVAEDTGIIQQTLYRFRDSETGMNAENVLKLMKYLGIKVEDLV